MLGALAENVFHGAPSDCRLESITLPLVLKYDCSTFMRTVRKRRVQGCHFRHTELTGSESMPSAQKVVTTAKLYLRNKICLILSFKILPV